MARTRLALLVFVLALLVAAPAVAQCPMCKAAINSEDGAAGGVAQAYNITTLILFSSPFILLGIVMGAIYLSVRSARTRAANEKAQAQTA